MLRPDSIADIVGTYTKYGWVLRRVLISPESGAMIDVPGSFPGIPVKQSDLDAAWFSRPPAVGPIPWEIRYLGDIPFALLEHLDERAADFEAALSAVEDRLCEKIRSGNISLTTATADSKLE